MKNKDLTTRQLIIDAGKKEFLEKGFRGASLRTIAQNTTGKNSYNLIVIRTF